MKLTAVRLVWRGALAAAARFPLVVAVAILATAGGFILVAENGDSETLGVRLLFTALLGIPLFFALAVTGERHGWRRGRTALLELLGIVLLLLFYFQWPSWSEDQQFSRWFQLAVGFHLLVAVLPYATVRELNGFWQYNRALLFRFAIAAFFSAVLFMGLASALAAIDQLLGIEVEEEMYARLWFLLAFTFNTWYFVAGAPDDLPGLEEETFYPVLLKVFAQFILLPLVIIYLAILTVYLGQILVTREWPSGWIGYLVSGVSALGILTLLLVHPVRERAENRWVDTYARWFFIALLPSIVMLFMAIGKRIDQYGITERRYFLVVLAIWLGATAVHYTVSRSRNIKLIPATLCGIAFFTFLGPWSAYSVSQASQVGRLEGLLARHGMLVDRSVRPAPTSPPFEERREISAILRYLVATHGTAAIAPWFTAPPLAEVDTLGTDPADNRVQADARARRIAAHLGVQYVSRDQAEAPDRWNFAVTGVQSAVPVAGFEYSVSRVNLLDGLFTLAGDSLRLRQVEERTSVELVRGDDVLLEIPLLPLLERLRAYRAEGGDVRKVPHELMTQEAQSERAQVRLAVTRITGEEVDEGVELRSATADLYLRLLNGAQGAAEGGPAAEGEPPPPP